eukprot:NODE_325_length_3164_cov_1.923609.p1 GENE.NODE_325_length_3164_cov_1.923609~~NODE_325_length_3164_cov_1.923609.p1  ORF type:complete len:178 (+),score=24.63 NODE_325_length_3164_cov_1.923609:1282-1815(+)
MPGAEVCAPFHPLQLKSPVWAFAEFHAGSSPCAGDAAFHAMEAMPGLKPRDLSSSAWGSASRSTSLGPGGARLVGAGMRPPPEANSQALTRPFWSMSALLVLQSTVSDRAAVPSPPSPEVGMRPGGVNLKSWELTALAWSAGVIVHECPSFAGAGTASATRSPGELLTLHIARLAWS